VLGQRALGAEPTTADSVVAIKIITRTECHCAYPEGTTSKEREGLCQVATTAVGFYNRICPKEGNPITRVSSALTCPNEDLDGNEPSLPSPFQPTFLMNFVPSPPRGCGILYPSPFSNGFVFLQCKHAIATTPTTAQ
jgi:hypothetical protein